MSRTLSNLSFCLALVCLPWVGVGIFELMGLPSVGMGIQPTVLFCVFALLLSSATLWDSFRELEGALPLVALILTLVVGISSTWTLDHTGLFGELPWAKSLKQALQFVLYAAVGLTPVLLLDRSNGRAQLGHWERALSFGLLLSCIYGLIQAVDFFRPLDFFLPMDRWVSSNPSIASGSHELYLGHRFVGIPRIRSTACEPLYFASYLMMAVPIAVAAALQWSTGWARAWRLGAAILGCVCFVMTFSRGAYAAAAFGASIAAVLWLRAGRPAILARRSALWGGAAFLVVALLVGTLSGVGPWEIPALLLRRAQQSFAEHDMSNLTRFFAWEAGWRAFLQRPLTGQGWGSFGFLYYGLSPAGGAGAHFGWPVANSIPIRVLAEMGLLGATLSIWLLWPILLGLRGLWLSPKTVEIGGFLSILWVIAAFQGLTHSQIQLPHLWLLGALCLLLPRFRTALV